MSFVMLFQNGKNWVSLARCKMKSVKVFRPIYGFSAIITGTQIVCGGEQRYRPEMFAKAQGVRAKVWSFTIWHLLPLWMPTKTAGFLSTRCLGNILQWLLATSCRCLSCITWSSRTANFVYWNSVNSGWNVFFSSLPLFYNMHPAQCVLIEVDINDEFNRLQVVPS